MAEVMKMREEEKKRSSLSKILKKRWVFPAVYLLSAAVLISVIFWLQAGNETAQDELVEETNELTGMSHDEPAMEVNQALENVSMPVANEDEVNIVTQYFDAMASIEEQEAALIVDENKYHPNMGIDIAMNDGSEFEVLAALSGEVVTARQDSLLGNVIEVEHEDGIITVYQSVKDLGVKVGDTVKQGDVLATSGTSQINKEAKNHVHFEIRKNSTALNPLDFFGQPFTSLQEAEEQSKMEENEETTNEVEEEVDQEVEQEQTNTPQTE